ncbi:MAG TPA: ATP-binding protein, partial [Myxococcota bacterium]|nr:ATP-binding protein [Myxococcota bacterium]
DSALSSAARIHVEDRRQMERQDWEISRMRNDLKGAQTTLIRAEKLASVGQLAAGVAHEIGNPVGIILGMSDVLRQGGSSPEEVQRFSDEIHKATMRVDQTIRELLTFARPVRDEGARADVRQVVESTVKLVQTHKSFRNVMVCIDIGEECPVAEIRPSQLQQVLLNLFLNAAAAMNGEGRIEVSCRCEDRRLSIAVRDFGPGIPEKDLQRIFDPFFTTKPPGEGTGLGLAMSSQIVEIYGGEIEAESRIGEGAVFTVKLWMAQT